MMGTIEETKTKLKQLRDRLATEAPRARARAGAQLAERIGAALEMVNGAYLLAASPATGGSSTAAREEMYEDALVEGHLALHDWDRFVAQQPKPAAPAARARARSLTPPPVDRRQFDRYDTNIAARIVRHGVREDGSGGVTLDDASVNRPARNVSLGGILVAVPKHELPQVAVGSVVHVSVTTTNPPLSLQARATVMRRDDTGIGLSWTTVSEATKKTIQGLLEIVRKGRTTK
jgi:hypothetical protein